MGDGGGGEGDEALRQRLQRLAPHESWPPVTDSTRSLLRARLAKLEASVAPTPTAAEKGNGGGGVEPQQGQGLPRGSRFAESRSIPTLVFLDLEATGLQLSKPRITELSMVAVGLDEFQQLSRDLQRAKAGNSDGLDDAELPLPRVLNKLTLCFNPCKAIPPAVTRLTRLDNFRLEDQRPFDAAAARAVRDFLSRLAAPACLLAHNGGRYDFPLLLAELERAEGGGGGADKAVLLPDDLLCLDTLPLMREVLAEERADAVKREVAGVAELVASGAMDDDGSFGCSPILWEEEAEVTPVATPTKADAGGKGLSPGGFALPVTPPTSDSKRPRMEAMGVGDTLPKPCFKNLAANFKNGSSGEQPHNQQHPHHGQPVMVGEVESREENEVTPDKRIPERVEPPPAPKRPRRQPRFAASTTDAASANGRRQQQQPPPRARKRLDFDSASPSVAATTSPPRGGHSLPSLHAHLLGRVPQGRAHGAEYDCLALMRVCAARADAVLRAAVTTAKPFTAAVTRMW